MATAFVKDFGVMAADALAIEHDVIFAVPPDAGQAAAQRVSGEAAGADQGQARIARVLVLDRREISGGNRFVNYRSVNHRFVLGRRSPLLRAILLPRGAALFFEIRTPDPGSDEFSGNCLEDLRVAL